MEEIDGCRRWEVGGDWEDRGDGACVLDDGSPVVYTKLITLMRKVWGVDLSHTTQAKRACFSSGALHLEVASW